MTTLIGITADVEAMLIFNLMRKAHLRQRQSQRLALSRYVIDALIYTHIDNFQGLSRFYTPRFFLGDLTAKNYKNASIILEGITSKNWA